eukprot:gnl/Trimastix_PCT/2435.p1 GENE.gnl/Trimastix_PCT/2435~~gnl/Trimastix_PCT/2435.p1  ORF type:complete len:1135 (-),score=287.93 gnl/Trimastix_PCT/2435:173-3577(-)
MSGECGVRVIARFRPFNAREQSETVQGAEHVKVLFDLPSSVTVKQQLSSHTFSFDRVFPPGTSQQEVYSLAACETVNDVIQGYNGTIFAYGQTGSGKSWTMFGPDIGSDEDKGIIPRSAGHIFKHIAEDTTNTEFTIKCAFLEIYNEQLRDLLNPGSANLQIRESPQRGIYVSDLTEQWATCEDDVFDILHKGENARAVSFTQMNPKSSRSHSIFMMIFHQRAPDGSQKSGKMNLVDLAGSEKVGKTGAKDQTLKEALKINGSLTALGMCINALVEGKPHIPYRDSKLTRVLQESLGGNCKTTLLVGCSQHPFNIEETVNTLKFAQRAKTIKTRVKVNAQRSAAELMRMIDAQKRDLARVTAHCRKLEELVTMLRSPDHDRSVPIHIPSESEVCGAPEASSTPDPAQNTTTTTTTTTTSQPTPTPAHTRTSTHAHTPAHAHTAGEPEGDAERADAAKQQARQQKRAASQFFALTEAKAELQGYAETAGAEIRMLLREVDELRDQATRQATESQTLELRTEWYDTRANTENERLDKARTEVDQEAVALEGFKAEVDQIRQDRHVADTAALNDEAAQLERLIIEENLRVDELTTQAEKATLNCELASAELDATNAAMQHADDVKLQAKLNELQSSVTTLQTQEQEMLDETAELNQLTAQLTADYEEATAALESSSQELETKRARTDELRKQQQDLESAVTDLETQLEDIQRAREDDIVEKESQMEKLSSESDAAKERLSAVEQQVEHATSDLQEMEEAIADTEQQIEELQSVRAELEAECKDIHQSLDPDSPLAVAFAEMHREVDAARTEAATSIQERSQACADIQSQINTAKQELESIKAEQSRLGDDLGTAEERLKTQQERLIRTTQHAAQRLAELEKKHEKECQEFDLLETECSKLRTHHIEITQTHAAHTQTHTCTARQCKEAIDTHTEARMHLEIVRKKFSLLSEAYEELNGKWVNEQGLRRTRMAMANAAKRLRDELADLEAQIQSLNEQAASTTSQLDALRAKTRDAESHSQQYGDTLASQEDIIATKRAQLDSLRTQNTLLLKSTQDLDTQLTAQQENEETQIAKQAEKLMYIATRRRVFRPVRLNSVLDQYNKTEDWGQHLLRRNEAGQRFLEESRREAERAKHFEG